jgi:hypothetical protein
MAKTKREHISVGESMKTEKPVSMRFYATEVKQLIEKGVVSKEDMSKDFGTNILKKLGVTPEMRKGRGGSALIALREQTGMTPTEVARIVLSDKTMLDKLKK